MEVRPDNVVQLELPREILFVLDAVASKQGLAREQVASEAIALWVEQYREHGPAFSRHGC